MPFNQVPDLQSVYTQAGVRLPFGTLLAPGVRVAAYVRSGGMTSEDPVEWSNQFRTTLNAGLALARPGKNDIVYVLPGHTENLAAADVMTSLVAGTRIVGFGRGSNMPTLRWTATAATFLLDVADVCIQGLRLRMEGANGVVAPITISAADCCIADCDIEVASGATAKATTAITFAAGSARGQFLRNFMRGTAAHNCTDIVKVSAAVANVEIGHNRIFASATAANGLIHVTAAATELFIHDNELFNTHTNSSSCITFDDVACTGVASGNRLAVLNAGTAASQGITFGTAALIRAFENYCSDEAQKSGALAPAAAT